MRIDRLADQRIQAVGGRFSIRPVGRDDLQLSNGRILQFPQIERLDLRCGFFLIFRLDELKIRTIEQAAVFLVDEFGVVGDQAVLGLPEDLIENRHRYDATSNQLCEHVAHTDALQLVNIAQQQEFCPSPQARKQLMRQPHINHGRLIHDQKINLQLLILLVLAAKIALQAKQTVQRQCIQHTGALCHASAGFAGRRGEDDAVFGMQNPVDLDDSFQNCRLASAGAAGDNGEIPLHRHLNAAALPLC